MFVNGITDNYLLSIEGRCSLDHQRDQLEVTCQTADDNHMKHFLRLSNNVTYVAEQIEPAAVDAYHYRVTFKPASIMPNVDFRDRVEELLDDGSENDPQ